MRWLRKDYSEWHEWFAWHAVRIEQETVWLERIERRLIPWGWDGAWEYRFLEENGAGAFAQTASPAALNRTNVSSDLPSSTIVARPQEVPFDG